MPLDAERQAAQISLIVARGLKTRLTHQLTILVKVLAEQQHEIDASSRAEKKQKIEGFDDSNDAQMREKVIGPVQIGMSIIANHLSKPFPDPAQSLSSILDQTTTTSLTAAYYEARQASQRGTLPVMAGLAEGSSNMDMNSELGRLNSTAVEPLRAIRKECLRHLPGYEQTEERAIQELLGGFPFDAASPETQLPLLGIERPRDPRVAQFMSGVAEFGKHSDQAAIEVAKQERYAQEAEAMAVSIRKAAMSKPSRQADITANFLTTVSGFHLAVGKVVTDQTMLLVRPLREQLQTLSQERRTPNPPATDANRENLRALYRGYYRKGGHLVEGAERTSPELIEDLGRAKELLNTLSVQYETSTNSTKRIVPRIDLENDRVSIHNGITFLNGAPPATTPLATRVDESKAS